jgi:hypothetical protein
VFVTTAYTRWLNRYSSELGQNPKLVQTLAIMFFSDLETEMGTTMDWCCARAAEEGIPVPQYIAEVVKQYRDDLVAQEQRAKQLAFRRRRFARISASGVAGNPAE